MSKNIYSPVTRKRFDTIKEWLEDKKPKKTTDDCYTPEFVYEEVLQFVREKADIEGLEVIRPFRLGGDYEAEDYRGKVVVDNPPFSILAKIKRFYTFNKIPYFLFAPTLTLFSGVIPPKAAMTFIVSNAGIQYENKVRVNTSFVSNLFGDLRIWLCPELKQRIEKRQRTELKKTVKNLPAYTYPPNVVTAVHLNKWVNRNVEIKIKASESYSIKVLDHQREQGNKAIFGGGFLINDLHAQYLQDALKHNPLPIKEQEREEFVWEISEREREIIEQLQQ